MWCFGEFLACGELIVQIDGDEEFANTVHVLTKF